MRKEIKNSFSSYVRGARLYPALIALLPIAVTFLALLGSRVSILISIVTFVSFFGITYLLTIMTRALGKARERNLFQIWGGPPTTIVLRHSDSTIDSVSKKRYHKFLSKAIGVSMPTEQIEERDPQKADQIYGSAIIWLVENTRDFRKDTILLEENTSYGFHRNLLGLSTIGFWLAIISFAISGGGVFIALSNKNRIFSEDSIPLLITSVFLSLALSIFWRYWVSTENTRKQAYTYAIQLIKLCDVLIKRK